MTQSIAAAGGWGSLILLPGAVLTLTPLVAPRWLIMWLFALAIFAACKCLTWRRVSVAGTPWHLQASYLFAWPGMDAAGFLARTKQAELPSLYEWLFAVGKTLLGGVLYWLGARHVPEDAILLRGWTGLVGLAFLLHFGTFHILSCVWRRLGRNARPLMNWPVLATSVSDFWGWRWHTAFRDLAHRFLFQPLSRVCGPRAAIVLGFAMGGLVHDLVISVPAGGGYGLPTLYFLIQGVALLGERSRAGLNWKTDLQVLPCLHRQLFWVYGGYVVLAISALGLGSMANAAELARGSLLARCVCGYIAIFWGIRLALQTVLDVREHLTTWWLKAGYHTLTVVFATFTAIFAWAAIS
jgi:hypothetical protein